MWAAWPALWEWRIHIIYYALGFSHNNESLGIIHQRAQKGLIRTQRQPKDEGRVSAVWWMCLYVCALCVSRRSARRCSSASKRIKPPWCICGLWYTHTVGNMLLMRASEYPSGRVWIITERKHAPRQRSAAAAAIYGD